MDDDDPRELAEYEVGDGIPSWERRRRMVRWIALIALFGLLVPSAIGSYATARSTAEHSCRLAVDFYAGDRVLARAAFELWSPVEPGWHCYAVLGSGEVLVAVLGLIPGAPRLVPRTLS